MMVLVTLHALPGRLARPQFSKIVVSVPGPDKRVYVLVFFIANVSINLNKALVFRGGTTQASS